MSSKTRLLALALCAFVVFVLCAGSACIAHETAHHHDCTGEDCPICQFIARIEQVRRALGSVLPALLGAWLVVITCRETRERTPADAPVFSTLVGRKIRLND
jgi:hypothetical protein